MPNAKIDDNWRDALIAVSTADGETPVRLEADPTTHALLTQGPGGGSVFGDVRVSDGTNVASVVAGDTGFNSLAVADGVKTMDFSTSVAGAQMIGPYDCRGYSWVEVVYTSVGSGLALSGQFSPKLAGAYNSSATFLSTGSTIGALGVTNSTVYYSVTHGNYFQINVTALTSGTFAGTITFRTLPPPYESTRASQVGTWNVGSSTATGAAIPANAFYMAGINASGNLTGIATIDRLGDAATGSGVESIGAMAFNGTNYDRVRNNTTGVLVAAGTTTTQSNQTLTTYNASRLMLLVNITAGAGSVTVAINGTSSSGYSTNLLTSAALTGAGTTALRIFDGATPAANLVANDMLPRNISITATVTGSCTYGIDWLLGV